MRLTCQTFLQSLWPEIETLLNDSSWRVRYACLQQLKEICQSAGKELVTKFILKYYVQAMKDEEIEIRQLATKNLRMIAEFIEPEEIINQILPILERIVETDETYLRSMIPFTPVAASESIFSLVPILSKRSIKEGLMKLYEKLLVDPCVEVRLNIFKTVHELTTVSAPPS